MQLGDTDARDFPLNVIRVNTSVVMGGSYNITSGIVKILFMFGVCLFFSLKVTFFDILCHKVWFEYNKNMNGLTFH
ncbi:MAG: hypothetical protein ACI9HU_000402 [Colwellia sp.]|jgi:hypothetical protein